VSSLHALTSLNLTCCFKVQSCCCQGPAFEVAAFQTLLVRFASTKSLRVFGGEHVAGTMVLGIESRAENLRSLGCSISTRCAVEPIVDSQVLFVICCLVRPTGAGGAAEMRSVLAMLVMVLVTSVASQGIPMEAMNINGVGSDPQILESMFTGVRYPHERGR
jgi:hypothetical protein